MIFTGTGTGTGAELVDVDFARVVKTVGTSWLRSRW